MNTTLDGGDVQQAIDKFEKAVQNDPKNASIVFNLAVLYDKANNTEKALSNYLKAIEIKPDYGDAYFNMGVMYFNQGVQFNKKMNDVDEKVDKDGKIYDGLKKQRDEVFAKALPYLEKAYAINPKNNDYKSNLKKVYASMNLFEKAKAIIDVSIGSTVEEVIKIYGSPKNISKTTTVNGTEELYMYDNVTVNFDKYGKVNYINIIK
mgnify:CR=1 FL=1